MIVENYAGLACPEPVMRCRDFLSKQKPEKFSIIVDNQGSSENVKRFLEKNNYSAEIEKKSDKEWLLSATLTSSAGVTAVQEEQTKEELSTSIKTLVIIPSETLGSGDDILGTKLMESFLNTLPELGDNLWKVVMLNGGVKLSAKPGKALEALQKLEAAGIELLVCGTCLEFYGLTNTKLVGENTNMLDIVTSIDLADKVICL